MILGELFVAEFQGLKSLDDDDISTLFMDDFQDNPFNHLVLSGEVALVLARANPSVRRLFSAISATSTRTRLAASFSSKSFLLGKRNTKSFSIKRDFTWS
jgi:hypothetical protein